MRHKPLDRERVIDNLDREGLLSFTKGLLDEYRVQFDDVFVHLTRTRHIARVRRHFFALVHWTTGMNASRLARVVGVDRTTVLEAVSVRETELLREYHEP